MDIENRMVERVWNMSVQRVFITGDVISEKSKRVQHNYNAEIPENERTRLKFSRGRLTRFRKRNKFKCDKTQWESGYVSESVIEEEVPILKTLLSAFKVRDTFNADEFSLFYRQIPISTIGTSRFAGKKKRRERLAALICTNAEGTNVLYHSWSENPHKPRSFNGQSSASLGFYYAANTKAWMNRLMFYGWLFWFDSWIAQTLERRAVLLIDNCSAHGHEETVPDLLHADIVFLLRI